MRLIYVLLSPTFGMHQYTADLANRAVGGAFSPPTHGRSESADVHVVTTRDFPADRYDPRIAFHTPLASRTTGFSAEGADLRNLQITLQTVQCLAQQAPGSVVHITGVHLWNPRVVQALRRAGVPVIHTLHDLAAHSGVRFGTLIPRWNRLVIAAGAHIVVHGERYRQQLIASGLSPERVTYTPLLHGFWSYDANLAPVGGLYSGELDSPSHLWKTACGAPVLFFGRVERYKGVDTLLTAWSQLGAEFAQATLVVAGSWAPDMKPPDGLPRVVLHDRRIGDAEAIRLFRSASLLVLPYRDATQSALIAAGYQFGLPVVVSDAGALTEYVVDGETGWVFPAGDSTALTAVLQRALSCPDRLPQMGAAGGAWYGAQRQLETDTLMKLYGSQAAAGGR